MSEESTNLAMAIMASLVSGAATVMFARPVYETLPDELKEYLFTSIQSIFNLFSNDFTMVIDEFDKLVNNEIYEAAEIYLGGCGAMVNSSSARQFKISRALKEKNFNFKMEKEQEIVDVFNGVNFRWRWVVEKAPGRFNRFFNFSEETDVRSFKLTFHKKYKNLVIDSYLPFLLNQAKLLKHEKKTVKIFTAVNEWTGITLDHPATFDTLAMDSEQKDMILKDLDRFVKRGDYYRKVGKAWKRGYLLYGPPGTGKSSLIAAMANYLNFDIYDLELTAVKTNSHLRQLLVDTANKSILVVEDIDCTIEFKERATNQAAGDFKEKSDTDEEKQVSQVTLSGFLNFIDGLWSSCGDERIIIFTTNHIEKLDPALLRPGRMDVHIHMSFCTPNGFRILIANYLGLKNHPLFEEIEELIRSMEVTPAEVAEQLLRHDEAVDAKATLHGLTGFLLKKKKEKETETDQESMKAVN